jgi:hypothetical protein
MFERLARWQKLWMDRVQWHVGLLILHLIQLGWSSARLFAYMQQSDLYNCWLHDQNFLLIIQKHVLNSTDFGAGSFWQWILYCHRKLFCGHSLLWGWSCRQLSMDSLSQEMDSTQMKFFYDNTLVQYRLNSWPQWLRGVSRVSAATRLLGLWVRIPQGHECLSLVSVVCCHIGRSVQRYEHLSRRVLLNVVCVSVIVKPRQREVPAHKGL